MKFIEFCEKAFSNDIIAIKREGMSEIEKIQAAFRFLLDKESYRCDEVKRFSYGKIEGSSNPVLIVELAKRNYKANKECEKVLKEVDEALQYFEPENITVEIGCDGFLLVNVQTRYWNNLYATFIARYRDCNIEELEKALALRKVRHRW